MIDRNHPAVEAARRALANDETNGCMIEQHEGNGMWTCLAHGVSADGPDMCWYVRDMPPIALNAAREHYTADDLRNTPAGQALIAEGRGWTPTTERDRRALAILNDPTVPAGTRHILAKGIRLLHKLERLNKR